MKGDERGKVMGMLLKYICINNNGDACGVFFKLIE